MSGALKLRSCAAALAAGLLGAGVCRAEVRPVGLAVFVNGEARLERAGAAARALAVNDSLYLGDVLRTGPGGRASLVLLYGSELRLNENTALEFIAGASGRDEARLHSGQVWTRLLHRNGGIVVRTAAGVCAVRGTEADFELRERTLLVKVYEGHVDVENGSGRVSLSAGEMTRVADPAAAPARPWRLLPAGMGKWQEGVTSPEILSFLGRLEAAGGEKALEFDVGGRDGKKGVRIKLKRKEAPAAGGN